LQNLPEDERKLEMTVKVISTECTKEQEKEDMPKLVQMHAQALQADMMWEFFGGMITLPNGHSYQVINI
tara:strand:+ start:340 stop:546 length:207 start_codon:yes stop_codon:yes gene_type:complete